MATNKKLLLAKTASFFILLATNTKLMAKALVGRLQEIKMLDHLLTDSAPQLVAILGRRRVGKTFLVRTHYSGKMTFECSGTIDGSTASQLANFSEQLKAYFKMKLTAPPANWQQAFVMLEQGLASSLPGDKKILFFDEFPWMDNHRSGFLSAFSYWWNMHGSQRVNCIVIICGSAASWMINRVVNNKGGLHNRITHRIHLLPFTLAETAAYLQANKVKLTSYQIVQLYMVMGGIPHYLDAVLPGMSVEQVINPTCFNKNGRLYGEFDNLYAALFSHPEKHIQLVKLLAGKQSGLTRNEIVTAIKKLTSGGGLTKALDELTESGFLYRINPYGNKVKDAVYRLADEFTLFYFRFMAKASEEAKEWNSMLPTNAFAQWSGYAFENVCLKHINMVKKALGIAAVYTEQSAWRFKGDAAIKGAQVDLLIDRADNCINLCEIKFSAAPFLVTKRYADELLQKEQSFRLKSKSRKVIFTTLISPFGVVKNEYQLQRIQSTVTMNDLFG